MTKNGLPETVRRLDDEIVLSDTDGAEDKQDIYLGIDIGGTNTKFGFIAESEPVRDISEFSTDADKSFDSFLSRLENGVSDIYQELEDRYDLRGIGIGAPNANYWTGYIEEPSNLSWGTVDILTAVEKMFGVPVVVTNDANAAAMGEKYFGAARHLDDFLLLTLGTGLGGGIVSNGRLIHGKNSFAGEIGHMVIQAGGRLCGCGRRGCLEGYVSATGIKRTLCELMSIYNRKTTLSSVPYDELRPEMITEAARKGDQLARQCFEETGAIFGRALADLVALLNPEAIILAGGLAHAGDLILDPVRRHLEANVLKIYRGQTHVLISPLLDKNLAVLGATALIREKTEAV